MRANDRLDVHRDVDREIERRPLHAAVGMRACFLERQLRVVAGGIQTVVVELDGYGQLGRLAARHRLALERAGADLGLGRLVVHLGTERFEVRWDPPVAVVQPHSQCAVHLKARRLRGDFHRRRVARGRERVLGLQRDVRHARHDKVEQHTEKHQEEEHGKHRNVRPKPAAQRIVAAHPRVDGTQLAVAPVPPLCLARHARALLRGELFAERRQLQCRLAEVVRKRLGVVARKRVPARRVVGDPLHVVDVLAAHRRRV